MVGGLLIGWSVSGSLLDALLAVGLLLWLRFAMLWLGVFLGLAFRSEGSMMAVQVLVWPIGVISMQAYLAMFAQRMPLTPLPFVLALGIALAIAWIAAGAHIAAATRVEPARVLRRE